MTKPKVVSWNNVDGLNATWECPKGCDTPYIFECGDMLHGYVTTFDCECGYEEAFELKIKFKRVVEEEEEMVDHDSGN